MLLFALLAIRIHPLVPVRGERKNVVSRRKNRKDRGRERERDGKNRKKNEISRERNVAKAVKRKRHTVWYRLAGEAGLGSLQGRIQLSRFVLDFCGVVIFASLSRGKDRSSRVGRSGDGRPRAWSIVVSNYRSDYSVDRQGNL